MQSEGHLITLLKTINFSTNILDPSYIGFLYSVIHFSFTLGFIYGSYFRESHMNLENVATRFCLNIFGYSFHFIALCVSNIDIIFPKAIYISFKLKFRISAEKNGNKIKHKYKE